MVARQQRGLSRGDPEGEKTSPHRRPDALLLTALLLIAFLMSACQPTAPKDRAHSEALSTAAGADTALGRALAPQLLKHPGLSGVVVLPNSLDAFTARMLAISAAQRSIDIQYYIWRDDITGNLLLRALHEAAQRNVRVRLLIDDNGTSGLDGKLALLNAEPNAEVRLFNPFPIRRFKPLAFLTDFQRLNRRMHNKSFTVDGQLTIVGGRNIGDEYFGATRGVAFTDLDVMVAGTVVDDVSRDFDRYWNHEAAYPLEALVDMPSQRKAQALLKAEADAGLAPKAHAYVDALANSTFFSMLMDGTLEYEWVKVRMVSDDPDKALGKAAPEGMLTARLREVLETPTQSVDLISPYFVPTQDGVDIFGAWAQQGVRVRILTNAMEATDVLAVHGGYAPYRVPLLQHGVSLFEMRRAGQREIPKEKAGPFGSSGTSLHAKTFAVDGERIFVGSFNFDPRSAQLNTELGFVIESPAMAMTLSAAFENDILHNAYQLQLGEENNLVWLQRGPDGDITKEWHKEPHSRLWQRLCVKFLSTLPIESLL